MQQLQAELIDQIFATLTLTYGAEFLARWDGIDIKTVKAHWAHQLGHLRAKRAVIYYALNNLPVDRSPTVLQFRLLCTRAPEPTIFPRVATAHTPARQNEISACLRRTKAKVLSKALERAASK
jgi:hypothetical protein